MRFFRKYKTYLRQKTYIENGIPTVCPFGNFQEMSLENLSKCNIFSIVVENIKRII